MVGSRPDGWWRDRPGAFARLVADLVPLAAGGEAVTVVFDGRPTAGLPAGAHDGVTVDWADRPGRGAADDRIAALVAADGDPSTLTVVTSDRDLAARVVAAGASVVGAGAFRDNLGPGA